MKDIIINYLNKQYRFTPSTYVSYVLYDMTDKVEVGLPTVLKSIIKIFGIDETELMEIFDVWADQKEVEMNNRITDIKFEYYQRTGMVLEPSILDIYELAKSLEEEPSFSLSELNDIENEVERSISNLPIPPSE